MKSDTFEVLAVLMEASADGGEILDRVEKAGGKAPAIPTLYRRLREAVDAGWVVVESGTAEGPGRPGQRYGLAPAGRAAVRAEAERWKVLAELALGSERLL